MGRVLSRSPVDRRLEAVERGEAGLPSSRCVAASLPPSDDAMALPAPKGQTPSSKSVRPPWANALRPCTWSISIWVRVKCWVCAVRPVPVNRPWPVYWSACGRPSVARCDWTVRTSIAGIAINSALTLATCRKTSNCSAAASPRTLRASARPIRRKSWRRRNRLAFTK